MFPHDPNLTIEVLRQTLLRVGAVPQKLYIQLDNCARENKNKALFAFCAWLVLLHVTEEVEVSFLPVGHMKLHMFCVKWRHLCMFMDILSSDNLPVLCNRHRPMLQPNFSLLFAERSFGAQLARPYQGCLLPWGTLRHDRSRPRLQGCAGCLNHRNAEPQRPSSLQVLGQSCGGLVALSKMSCTDDWVRSGDLFLADHQV